MWEIHIVTVGKAKDEGIREGLARYARMVRGEWRLCLESVSQSKSGAADACRREEGLALRGRLRVGSASVALDASGESMNSVGFAGMLGRYKDAGKPVAFLVGGPHGLDRETVEACDRRLSLSPMTLPHELAALVLAEQVYRAYAAGSRRAYAK